MSENEKTTPWWATLVAAIMSAILSVTAYIILSKPGSTISTPGLPAMPSTGVLTDTISYIPHILLLFGVLADMFTYEGVYSIPSLIGLLSIPVNFAFQFFWRGVDTIMTIGSSMAKGKPSDASGTPTSSSPEPTAPITGGGKYFNDYNGCAVQGFEKLSSKYSPQTLVVTATIFSYYIFDLLNNRGTMSAIGSIVVGLVVFIAQGFVIGSCNEGMGTIASLIRSGAEGMFIGGVSYSVVQTYYPNRLPSSVISSLKSANPADLSTGADGKLYDSSGKRFVMMDGQAVPDTCGAGSSSNGTTSDGTSTGGAGTAASSSSCPN